MLADFEQTMQLAAQESERHGHSYLGTEHVLLGLLRTSNARALRVLRSRGLTAEIVEAELGRLEAENVMPCRHGGRELLRELELAERHAHAAGREQATTDDVVIGILRDAKDPLGTQLSRRGKRSLLQLDLVPGSPAPVRLIVEARGLKLDQLDRQLTAHDQSGE